MVTNPYFAIGDLQLLRKAWTVCSNSSRRTPR